MKNPRNWLRQHKFECSLAAFGLIGVPSALLYPAAQARAAGWIIVFIGIIVMGNLLAAATD